MKIKLTILFLFAACAIRAQTNTTPITPPPGMFDFNWLTNIPAKTNFQLMKFEFSVSPVIKNGELENENWLRTFIKTNYSLGLSLGISPSTAVINRASLEVGYRYVWPNAEIIASAIGRRNWATDSANTHPSWQGGLGLEANWTPMTDSRWKLGMFVDFLSSDTGAVFQKPPKLEWGPKLTFGF